MCVCFKDPVEHRQAALPPLGRLVLMTSALQLLQGMGDSLHNISNIVSKVRRWGKSQEWNGEKYAVKGRDSLWVQILNLIQLERDPRNQARQGMDI